MDELFNQLEDELSKQGLFARRIDIDKCIEILHTLRKNYEYAVTEANHIMETRNKILANADNVAKNTIKEAEKRAHYASEAGRYVYRTSEETQSENTSYGKSEELFDKTKVHIDDLFREVEEYLLSMVDLVRKNREELNSLKFKVR